ncbi:MAG: hypothetical protein CVU99_14925 [Firmicutes bacterium HGW-Firmicutes-4]|jgi:hypothetical protein|nr:MAG: hypothetical protein CVU99_14925 [Firmicutes bacterium HGW-Firmicutes-4]
MGWKKSGIKKNTIWSGLIALGSVLIIGIVAFFMINRYFEIRELKIEYQEEIDFYQKIGRHEQEWIAQMELSNGAFPFCKETNGTANIVPYFSDNAAIALLSDITEESYLDEVIAYMDWHLKHLNTANDDLYGVDGTIYDYTIIVKDGVVIEEISEGSYDSMDSYAATFIMLLGEYYEKTGDENYLIKNRNDIFRIIRAMAGTIDEDGLSIVKDGYPIKYLMDNTEVNMGLKDAIFLLEKVYLNESQKDTQNYEEALELKNDLEDLLTKNTIQIDELLWNDSKQRYEVGLNNNSQVITFKGWDQFYPDAVLQLFPIIYEIDSIEDEQAKFLYAKFSNQYDWQNFGHFKNDDASFYWPLLAYAGAMMEDEVRVKTYILNYQNTLMKEHAYPVYISDAAWIVRSCNKMINHYEGKMLEIDPFGLVKTSKD